MAKYKVDEVVHVAKQISNKRGFPVESYDDLANALGGESGKIRIGEKEHKVSAASRIPEEFYPLESEEDFIAKVTSLQAAAGDTPDVKTEEPSKELPPEAGDRPEFPESMRPKKGVPGARGSKG